MKDVLYLIEGYNTSQKKPVAFDFRGGFGTIALQQNHCFCYRKLIFLFEDFFEESAVDCCSKRIFSSRTFLQATKKAARSCLFGVTGARYWIRTSDPRRVKAMLYH